MKDWIFANYCCRTIAFVCITVAAIKLENAALLWWYIVPLLMSMSVKEQ